MSDQPYLFSLCPDSQALASVRQGLEQFNARLIGVSAYTDFELYARDADGQLIGGMFGHSGMGWLYIDYLWLSEDQRNCGLGSELLKMAEQEAQKRGCTGVFLYSYSFQAPAFYQKQGYQIMGMLEECPPGHQRYYLKKILNP